MGSPTADEERPSASETRNIDAQNRPGSSPPTVQFQFVNISEPTEIHGEQTRKLIRSSVAQDYRRKQTLRHSDGSPYSCIDACVASMIPVLNFCPVCGHLLARKRHSAKSERTVSSPNVTVKGPNDTRGLGAGRVDPFSAFPIPTRPYMHILIDHYVTNYCATFQPYGKWDITTSPIIIRLFRGFALQEPIYFHATLSIAATHLNVSSGESTFEVIAAFHSGETIKLLNGMLQDPECEITELVIAVVGSLANHDIMIGDKAALYNHQRGMVEMLKRKGGIHHPSLMRLLKYRAIWIDFMSAVFNETMPLFPDDEVYIPQRLIEHVSIQTTSFYELTTSSVILPTFVEMLEELSSLNQKVLRLRDEHTSTDEMICTTSRRARIERALYTTQFDNTTRGGELQHCLRVAMLIYTNLVFRLTPDRSAIFSNYTRQLKLALEKANPPSLWEGHMEILLWVLFVGGAVCMDKTTKAWYTSGLVTLCDYLKLLTWNECLVVLRNYLWSEQDLNNRCKSLWCEVVVNLHLT